MRRRLLCVLTALAGCSSDNTTTGTPDAPACATTPVSGMGVLKDFCPPPATDPGAKNILLTVSGETFAASGYDFPPAPGVEIFIVDGWEIRYDRVLVTFDKVRLNTNPDKVPTDQSQMGDQVAEVDGPWAVDLACPNNSCTQPGKDEEPNEAVALATISGQSLDPTMRYAFSFDGVAASANAKNVNLTAADITDYQDMIAKGYTSLYVGTATWKGAQGDNPCANVGGYDFSKLPTVVKLRFGFTDPAQYLNAQNPDLGGAGINGEESPRGIQIKANSSIVAQVTFHLDHAFWESFEHDSPAHFDQFASQYVGVTNPTATLEDMKGRSIAPFKDKSGATIPWRWCLADAVPTNPPTGGLTFDTLRISFNPGGSADSAIRDFYDYTLYNHSTWGHLNADGLSFVKRGYASPP
jgi:hypothetical protein